MEFGLKWWRCGWVLDGKRKGTLLGLVEKGDLEKGLWDWGDGDLIRVELKLRVAMERQCEDDGGFSVIGEHEPHIYLLAEMG